ncbi:MAG: S8 family serine peptidase [Phycisphaeraceae bacterium]
MRSKLGALLAVMVLALFVTGAARADLAWHLDAIRWEQAVTDARWADAIAFGQGQSIAIFDTGIDTDHLLLGGRSVTGHNFVSGELSPRPRWADANGHGSAVASVAAGSSAWLSTGTEIAGVAPLADLVAVRVLDAGGAGGFDSINAGLAWLIDRVSAGQIDLRAVNMSFGTEEVFTVPASVGGPVVDAFNQHVLTLRDLGIPVIAASGNGGSGTGLAFPAISEHVISVGAIRPDGSFANFSNRNAALDLAAPGRNIWGAYAGLDVGPDDLVAQWNGTSFAAPQVAGAVLLVNEVFEAAHGRLPAHDELLTLLRTSETTVVDTATGLTVPRLDLFAALEAAHVPEPGAVVVMMVVFVVGVVARPRGRGVCRRDASLVG